MTDASMARPGMDDNGDVGLVAVFDVGDVTAEPWLSSPGASVDSPSLARRRRKSRRGFGAICGRRRGDDGDVTDGDWEVGAWEVVIDAWLIDVCAVKLDDTAATFANDDDATDGIWEVVVGLEAVTVADTITTSAWL